MPRALQLAVVGTAGGVCAGLFGVGGGAVIVPLLILWRGYGEREATGTSLVAIVIIAAVGAAFQAAYGNVDVAEGVLIGLPAVGGVVAGTALQQRLPTRVIAGGFALFLVGSAITLLAG
jgi:uncharacterized membrane protein YfcA